MIWINDESETIQIPRHTGIAGDSYSLTLLNETTRQSFEFPNLSNISTDALLYEFEFVVDENMDEGQYSYMLYAHTVIDDQGTEVSSMIESGLLIYGDYEREEDEVSEYDPEINTIIQFNG